ncbi:MAG: lysyl-tRNA synthetase class I [Hyphomonadaceae bacterium]|nr:MAG: lysyl-tRNA synthetase class I [Hyphomonadaceae bacterium]
MSNNSEKTDLAQLAMGAKAWPFELARMVLDRHNRNPKDEVVFETGYGPSGLPHIGTFGEVVRTTMVRHAFEVLSEGKIPTRIICVSDDMDGMRKIPDNVPNGEMLSAYLQMPLTSVPDPFGTHESFAHHNNARLRGFLDSFGFDYEFKSATELYKSGAFDAALLNALAHFDEIMAVMLPSLGEERRATYSPFLPISPKTGRVLYVPMKSIDAKAGTISFEDEEGQLTTLAVTGGNVKMQWKPDFGMRWAALGVDFEMFGKDHQTNASIYSRICKILGSPPPVQYVYELFLDENGEKISKSKGNGISVEEWLKYAPQESLALYNFQKPRTAKKLYFDVIPKAMDEYINYLDAYHREDAATQLENPVWHIHSGNPPSASSPISYGLLLNLVAAADASNAQVLWAYIKPFAPDATPENTPLLARMVDYAIAYYHDFIMPKKSYREPSEKEKAAILALRDKFAALGDCRDGEIIQNQVYQIGKDFEFEPLRDWFKALYEVLLGQETGPRFGNFAALFGLEATIALMNEKLGETE